MKLMQTFKPDCVIQICLGTQGKQQKFSFGICMKDGKGTKLMEFGKFLGTTARAQASARAAKLSLEQALRLRREKIEIRVNSSFQVEMLEKLRSLPREEELKFLYEDLQRLLEGFRFLRVLQVPQEQMPEARMMAEGFFSRK